MNSIRNIIKLKKLLEGLEIKLIKGAKDVEITGLSSNSKQVAPGFLYIAKRGMAHDGNEFVQDAILAGAVAILSDLFNPFLEGVTQIIVDDTKVFEPLLAARFYDYPFQKLFLVGITGTSGKTTTSYLIHHILEEAGLIGTIESIIGQHHIKSDLTTPDCITCYKLLKEMCFENLTSAVMEVTSHALSQNRVEGISFDVAIFTNITPEHLDYHGTMDAYVREKAKLFKKLKPNGVAIVNQDDPMHSFMKCDNKIITYGIEGNADYKAVDIQMDLTGSKFTIEFQGRREEIRSPLIGKFNVYNVLAAVATAIEKGICWEEIKKRVASFKSVPGRLERVNCKEGVFVFVDFSHKTDALKNVLETLQELRKKKIITIFGCGGNRDREKRPKMAKVAEEYSDLVIVTTDNPRNEDPEEIIREIQSGFERKNYIVEMDRKLAIQKGLAMLEKGDILLIAGKGHENSQIFADKSIFFDDVKVAEELANIVG